MGAPAASASWLVTWNLKLPSVPFLVSAMGPRMGLPPASTVGNDLDVATLPALSVTVAVKYARRPRGRLLYKSSRRWPDVAAPRARSVVDLDRLHAGGRVAAILSVLAVSVVQPDEEPPGRGWRRSARCDPPYRRRPSDVTVLPALSVATAVKVCVPSARLVAV